MAIAHKRKMTYEDYLKLPDQPRMELIHGEFRMSPSPNFNHQDICRNLVDELNSWIKKNDLGILLFAPMDVVLEDHEVVQPDILFISKERQGIIRNVIHGAPDLVVEIVSPSWEARDKVEKKAIYEEFGVREYWLVDPKNQTVTVLCLKSKKFEIKGIYGRGDVIESEVLSGFHLPATQVFKH